MFVYLSGGNLNGKLLHGSTVDLTKRRPYRSQIKFSQVVNLTWHSSARVAAAKSTTRAKLSFIMFWLSNLWGHLVSKLLLFIWKCSSYLFNVLGDMTFSHEE